MAALEILTKLIAYHIVINPWGKNQKLLLFLSSSVVTKIFIACINDLKL